MIPQRHLVSPGTEMHIHSVTAAVYFLCLVNLLCECRKGASNAEIHSIPSGFRRARGKALLPTLTRSRVLLMALASFTPPNGEPQGPGHPPHAVCGYFWRAVHGGRRVSHADSPQRDIHRLCHGETPSFPPPSAVGQTRDRDKARSSPG